MSASATIEKSKVIEIDLSGVVNSALRKKDLSLGLVVVACQIIVRGSFN